MEDQYEELSETEQALVAVRVRGDFVINSALDWIDRFHIECSEDLLFRLTKGIRALSKAMHGRSADDIVENTNSLLEIQTRLLLAGDQNQGPAVSVSQTSEAPRAHTTWSQSQYFSPESHPHRPAAQKNGPIFVSYARADRKWKDWLLVHLRPLERDGRIDVWHDGRLQPGSIWQSEIGRVLDEASSAILLVSANFMASDFIYTDELQPIARRARAGGVVMFPVIVGHCLFEEDAHLKDFQMFNDPEKPLSRLDSSDVDQVFKKLARAVLALSK